MFEKNKTYKRYIVFINYDYEETGIAMDTDSLEEVNSFLKEHEHSFCAYFAFDCEARKII